MKWVKVGSIARPKRKAEKTTRRVKVFLPIGAKLPGGYVPVVFIRKTADTKGGAK